MNSDEQPESPPLIDANPYASPESDVEEEVVEAVTDAPERPKLHSLRGGFSAIVLITLGVLLARSAGRPTDEFFAPLIGISGILIFWIGAGRGPLGARWLVGAAVIYQFAETMRGMPDSSHSPSVLAACVLLGGSLATLLLDQALSILFNSPEKEPPTSAEIVLAVLGFSVTFGVTGWLFYESISEQQTVMLKFADIYAIVLFGIACSVPSIPLLFRKYGRRQNATTTMVIAVIVTSLIISVMMYWIKLSASLLYAMPVVLVLQGYLAVVLYSFDYVLRCFGISIVATTDASESSAV